MPELPADAPPGSVHALLIEKRLAPPVGTSHGCLAIRPVEEPGVVTSLIQGYCVEGFIVGYALPSLLKDCIGLAAAPVLDICSAFSAAARIRELLDL